MLSDRLRDETFQSHVVVEKLIIPRIKSIQSNQEYSELLRIFYGYFKPVEEKIEQQINQKIVADIDERRKSQTILDDLQSLGFGHETVVCNDLPVINKPAHALGAMYVLEGSTLGGVHISKMIAARLKLRPTASLRFFNGYGSASINKWDFFREVLNNFTAKSEIENEVIASANQTFTKFKSWIELN